jgi:DNA-binding beta-propeller fold protein YncE
MRARLDARRTLFIVSILAVIALVGAFAYGPTGVAHDEDGDVNAAIYRSAGSDSHTLIPLDPRTLDDVETAESLPLPVTPWSLLVSRDGHVMAGVDNDGKLLVRNDVTGANLAVPQEWIEEQAGAISTAGYGWPVALNADGSKVLVQLAAATISWWKVFDTTTGEVLTEIREETGWSDASVVQVDPIGWKLYHLIESDVSVSKQEAPVPAELVAIDLNTGKEIGRTKLPDVEIGAWQGDLDPDPNGNMPIFNNYIPGFALSPDGAELAIVHATDDGVTLVDTATLTVSRTITMHEKSSMLGKIFAFIAPQTAEAKYSQGMGRTAFYAADGERLYVSGGTTSIDGETQVVEGHGLTVISLEDGEIDGKTLGGMAIDRLVEFPDGTIYATGFDYRPEHRNTPAQVIARLDAGATDVEAQRTLTHEYFAFVIVPAAET